MRKKIARHLALYAKLHNLLNTPTIVELDASNAQFTDSHLPGLLLPYQNLADGKTLVAKSNYGRNYLIGLRYKLD